VAAVTGPWMAPRSRCSGWQPRIALGGLPEVPTDLKMGHSGLGSVSHLTCLLYFQLISVEPTIVHNPCGAVEGPGPMLAVRVGEDVVILT
jgi:hypothetical protein